LCQQSAAFQQELWALQRGFSNSTASRPINNGAKRELDDDELKIEAMQSGVTEWMIETREWRRRREFPKGALEIVSSGTVYACHSFLSITLFTYIAARVADLDIDHLGFNKIKKPLIGLAEVRLKELNTDKEAWETPAISVAREETAQRTETAALSMQVNPQALPSSDAPVPFMLPSLSAPLLKPRSSSTKGRFCTPLKDPG